MRKRGSQYMLCKRACLGLAGIEGHCGARRRSEHGFFPTWLLFGCRSVCLTFKYQAQLIKSTSGHMAIPRGVLDCLVPDEVLHRRHRTVQVAEQLLSQNNSTMNSCSSLKLSTIRISTVLSVIPSGRLSSPDALRISLCTVSSRGDFQAYLMRKYLQSRDELVSGGRLLPEVLLELHVPPQQGTVESRKQSKGLLPSQQFLHNLL